MNHDIKVEPVEPGHLDALLELCREHAAYEEAEFTEDGQVERWRSAFFAERPEYVELLIQERAQFKDRTRPTYIEHRVVHVAEWRKLYGELTAAGRLREVPPQQISDVIGILIYGTMFTNYFAGPAKPVAEQARDILDVVFRGILSDEERGRLADADLLPPELASTKRAGGPKNG